VVGQSPHSVGAESGRFSIKKGTLERMGRVKKLLQGSVNYTCVGRKGTRNEKKGEKKRMAHVSYEAKGEGQHAKGGGDCAFA